METQKQQKLKIYVLAHCPSCDKEIYIKEMMTPTEVEEIIPAEQVQANKDKIKDAILKNNIFGTDEELANALKEIENPGVVYDDKDTQQAIEAIMIEKIRQKNDKPTDTKTTEDKELPKS